MDTITAYQLQKLIDYKNKLIEESDLAYSFASIEDNKIQEVKFITESHFKNEIAKKIEAIIYDKDI